MDSCLIDIEYNFIVENQETSSNFKKNDIKSFIIILLAFHIIIAQAGMFSSNTTKQTLELENNKKEAKMLMTNQSNKIVEQSNITTHEVNALQTIHTNLSKSYGILKKIIKKGAAPRNSKKIITNLNITNNDGIIIMNCNHGNNLP